MSWNVVNKASFQDVDGCFKTVLKVKDVHETKFGWKANISLHIKTLLRWTSFLHFKQFGRNAHFPTVHWIDIILD